MDQKDEPRGCACGSGESDLLRAPPPRKDWLRRTTCPGCGMVYWTDRETDYCMNCKPLAVAPSSRSAST